MIARAEAEAGAMPEEPTAGSGELTEQERREVEEAPGLVHGADRLATALRQAALPAKKRPDAVDARVAPAAARHGSTVVFTSDPDDIRAYLEVLSPSDH